MLLGNKMKFLGLVRAAEQASVGSLLGPHRGIPWRLCPRGWTLGFPPLAQPWTRLLLPEHRRCRKHVELCTAAAPLGAHCTNL